ncbi:MAG: ribonuclease III [Candidatus Sericytochromatia bacterium]
MANTDKDINTLLLSLDINRDQILDFNLLEKSLSHKSIKIDAEKTDDNERLEYLGDAVLKLSVSQWLYHNYPEYDEGVMSQTRAYVVSDKTLARIARKINLGDFIHLGKKEYFSGGRDKDSILANCLEALMGAIFLSIGFDKVAKMIITLLETELIEAVKGKAESENAKDLLQKLTQAKLKILPEYNSSHVEGPPHKAIFECILKINEKEYTAKGNSKKEAEQNAAKLALKDFEDEK